MQTIILAVLSIIIIGGIVFSLKKTKSSGSSTTTDIDNVNTENNSGLGKNK